MAWTNVGQIAVVTLLFFNNVYAQRHENTIWKNGRIRPSPSYLIAAPRRVRPDETVNVYVSVMKISYPSLTVKAAIRRDGEEVTAVKDKFHKDTTKLLQMKIPENSQDGNYTLRVEGSHRDEGRYGFIFENETILLFHPKRVSVFIQTDKTFYQKRETVTFRIIAITQDMLPVKRGSITIYIRDRVGRIVRRWLSNQLYNGVFEAKLLMSHPANHGWWTIEVHGWGYVYTGKFKTENNFADRFWPNVTMQQYVKDNEFAIGGVLVTRHQKGKKIEGNASVELEIRTPKMTDNFPVIKQDVTYFNGVTSFLFPLEEIRERAGTDDLVGTRLITRALVKDFYSLEEIPGQAQSFILDSDVGVKFIGGKFRTFKPGTNIDCYIVVYESDGSPLQRDRARQLRLHVTKHKVADTTSTDDEKALIIPDDSIVKYSIPTSDEDEMVTVRVNYGGYSAKYEEMIAYRHYSENGRYIYISTSTKKPEVNKYMVFTVRVSIYVEEVKYMITSGGQLLTADTMYMQSTQKTFSIALSRKMVPSARILVYCITPGGEVLADALSFHIDGIRTDGTKIRINHGKDFTKDTVEINAFSDPGTYIAFSVLQYDQFKFGANRAKEANIFFTKYALEEELETYDDHVNNSFKHTWLEDEGRKRNVYFEAPSSAIDANTTFSFVGLLIFSDANVPRIPGDELCNYTLGYLPCFDNSCFLTEQRCDGVKQCVDGADEMGCPEEDDVHRPDDFDLLYRHWWHLEDASWGWKEFYTKPYGRVDFTIPIPRRPTTWLIGAFALSVTEGLSFPDQPARLGTKKPFVCQLEMPKSCKRGEQIGVQVPILSFQDVTIEVLLTIKASDRFKLVAVEDKGVVSSYTPGLRGGDVQVMVYLEPGETKFIHFPVLPTVIGEVEVVIEADSFLRKYLLKKTITVEYDGVTNFYHTPYFINLVSQGSQVIPDLEIPVPEIFIHPEIRENLYVPGSPKATVSLVGDVLGAGFVTPHLNALNSMDLVVEGYGHEQMFTMAFNLNWLRFLKATNQLTPDLMNSVLLQLAKHFTALSSFMTDERAYSERHKSGETPDVTLTAFALETFALATQPEYEQILYIDVDIMNKMAMWLIGQQNKSNGAFVPPSPVQYDLRYMISNVTDENGVPLNMTQTAFAVIGLTKSLRVLTGVAQSLADSAAHAGADYLASHFRYLIDPFDICLVTYTLHVAAHRDRGYAFQKMQEIKYDGEFTYWSPKPIPPNPSEIINTVPFLKPNNLPLPWSSRAIQATSYGLMVYLFNNRFREAERIMEWLQTQRHSVNAWVGTQDSVAAVTALREYGERIANRHLFDMLVKLEATSTGWWKHDVHLARGSFLDFRQYQVPKVFGSVKTWATGTGLSLLQLRTEVNVEYPWQIREFPERSFDLDVNKLLFSGRNASHMYMDVCVKWARPDLAPRSGGVVLEIEIPTGFYVRKQTLRITVKGDRLPARRFRFARQTVLFYIDYIDLEGECYDFWGDRWYPVANSSIQHTIRVMDTSEPGLQNRTMYRTYTLFHLHICQVCGSYQCPYCPFYNAAVSSIIVKTSCTYLVMMICIYAFLLHLYPSKVT